MNMLFFLIAFIRTTKEALDRFQNFGSALCDELKGKLVLAEGNDLIEAGVRMEGDGLVDGCGRWASMSYYQSKIKGMDR